MQPENHGLYWSASDLCLLVDWMEAGKSIEATADFLHRTPKACTNMYRNLRRAKLKEQGAPEDTLKTFKEAK